MQDAPVPAESSQNPRQAAERRARGARYASLSSLAAKVITISASFIAIPMAQRYLGPERFGVWVTISSLMTLLSFADLGIGNGVMNAVAQAHGRADEREVGRIVSSAAFMLGVLGVILGLMAFASVHVFELESVLKLRDGLARSETRDALLVFAVLFGLNVVIGWIPRTQAGMQQGYLDGLTQALGGILTLVGVWLAVRNQGGLDQLVFGYMAGPLVASATVGLYFLVRHRRPCWPRWARVDLAVIRMIFQRGMLFFVLQLAAAIGFASDSVILSSRLGTVEAGDYAIAAKLFGAITILVNIYVMPLWPAYAEAHARGDHVWIAATLRRSLLRCIVFSIGAAGLLAVCYGPLTALWLGQPHVLPGGLLVACAGWSIVTATGAACAMLLNGLEVVRFQVMCALVFAFGGMAAKWLLVPSAGMIAIPVLGLIAYGVTHLVPYALFIPGKLNDVAHEMTFATEERR